MSIEQMTLALQAPLLAPAKPILVMLAWYAAPDGSRVFPSVDRVCRDTGFCRATVQRVLRQLVSQGWLIPVQVSRGKLTSTYRLDLANRLSQLPLKPEQPPLSAAVRPKGNRLSQSAQPPLTEALSVMDPSVGSKNTPNPLKGAGSRLSPKSGARTMPEPPGDHPRSNRDLRARSKAAWSDACRQIDALLGTHRTWADLNLDPNAHRAVDAAGGPKRIADRDRFTASRLEATFRERFERQIADPVSPDALDLRRSTGESSALAEIERRRRQAADLAATAKLPDPKPPD